METRVKINTDDAQRNMALVAHDNCQESFASQNLKSKTTFWCLTEAAPVSVLRSHPSMPTRTHPVFDTQGRAVCTSHRTAVDSADTF